MICTDFQSAPLASDRYHEVPLQVDDEGRNRMDSYQKYIIVDRKSPLMATSVITYVVFWAVHDQPFQVCIFREDSLETAKAIKCETVMPTHLGLNNV